MSEAYTISLTVGLIFIDYTKLEINSIFGDNKFHKDFICAKMIMLNSSDAVLI